MAPVTNKTKVKTGCRTCKARKVKCDEGWPSCKRCLSTGRVCEGYGIWGGGGGRSNRPSAVVDSSKCLEKVLFHPTPITTISKEESRCLEWFTFRSAFKLPGVFRFGFWDKLVFQAASNEPAVRHAVLALGSVHKRDGRVHPSGSDYIPDKEEQFTLQHYTKAITCLQPHFSAKNNPSVRVGLITCLIFIVMEFIQGHYKTGIAHLQSGLKLLDEFQARSNAIDNYSLFQEPCCDSVDAWIIQAFIRLDVQTKLLGQGSQYLNIVLGDCISEIPTRGLNFQSINQARQYLDRLVYQILYIGHEYRLQVGCRTKIYLNDLFVTQRCIKAKLGLWYPAFGRIRASQINEKASMITIAFPILHAYYLMAEVMADTCIQPADQLRYDAHTKSFESMMEQLKIVRHLSTSTPLAKILHLPNMSSTISDLGALPTLYCVATKCRVRRVRHDALDFLQCMQHKEGIWNGTLVAGVAKEVVKIEEGDFYEGSSSADEVSLCSASDKAEALQPMLPESYRMHDVKIELPEDYAGTVTLKCTRGLDDRNREVITREFVYNESAQRWIPR
ncbi:hypothetical protein F4781DRAFT_415932 [Annulohypoxylon bovei var. microspora]|nr:hypothetical protein F4781DRAFT_415932 [Annulohypoxylon bovei var. microspora]